ncbi:SDR family oxidoreductase [Pseudonocardia sp. HH130629-09]|uniref:SDR family oxidoreductase n=1 Tax=Pseudonocardia sp. HH130629-09 TaxID=1641402 RepID=UPI0006CB70EE|nr:SDR family oxidoreductase [Pseudonocardia sp. HH130629-09]ALE84855.1 short-chain dehydrogenase [Pseudonocardia sp. HH130629-09]
MTGSALAGRTAVVTGAASGIGAAVAARFVAEGASVLVCDVDTGRGAALAGELGPRARFRRVDVLRESDVEGAVAEVLDRDGRLDCLVANAGAVGRWRFVDDVPADEWDAAFALLCRSVLFGIKHAVPPMRASGHGSIVATGSVAGVRTGYGPHAHGAAKAAVAQLVRSAAVELAPDGIRVNTLVPGGVATRIVGHGAGLTGDALDRSVGTVRENLRSLQPLPRAGEPDDLADAAVFLASDASGFVTGQELVVDGGASLGRGWPADAVRAAARAQQRHR